MIGQLTRSEDRIRLRRAYEQNVRSGLYPAQETKLPLLPYQREGMLHLAFTERALLADLRATQFRLAAQRLRGASAELPEALRPVLADAAMQGDLAAVTVAVRARTNNDPSTRVAAMAPTVGVAPIAYNLGVAVGWKVKLFHRGRFYIKLR